MKTRYSLLVFVFSFALFASTLMNAAPALSWPWSSPEDLGYRASKISESDKLAQRELAVLQVPVQGKPVVAVKETLHYVHSRLLNSNQYYAVQVDGSADYVERLECWMFKDAEGTYFRIDAGGRTGSELAKPTIDIGSRASLIASEDSGYVIDVSPSAVSSDGAGRVLKITRHYTHIEKYDDLSYTVMSPGSAEYVPLQNAHMAWIDGKLYKVERSGAVRALREKPVADVGARSGKIQSSDRCISLQPDVSAGNTSFNGQTRILIVSRDYIHEESYQNLRYSIQESVSAGFVPEQNAHMVWIESSLYRVQIGSSEVERLSQRPVINIGQRVSKIDYSDELRLLEVVPLSLTGDSRSIVVAVRRHYRHNEVYQIRQYFTETGEIARYSEVYRVWVVVVDGRIYAIAFADDIVREDPDVVIVKAPGGLKKPDVIVVKPGNGDPPVVVPDKHKTSSGEGDPPVVVPDKHKTSPGQGDPPVVVPPRKKNPVLLPDSDDGPPLVVPRH